MNFTKSIFALALSGLVFVGCKNNAESTSEKTTAETAKTENAKTAASTTAAIVGKVEKVSFTIKGMTCAVMCAAKIEKELAAMDGVQKAAVDFDKETATVEFDDAKQSSDKLVTKVESIAGGTTYKVSNLQTATN